MKSTRYKEYYPLLEYCADPLFWSHYKICTATTAQSAAATAQNIQSAEEEAFNHYQLILDNIYMNIPLQKAHGVSQSDLIDCLGVAQRVACHTSLPRCRGGHNMAICKGLCDRFQSRCTVNGKNFIELVFNKSYPYYDCSTTSTDRCSPASRTSVMAVTAAVAMLVATAFLIA